MYSGKRIYWSELTWISKQMKSTYKDLTGLKTNMLTVIGFNRREGRYRYWDCQCECGNVKTIREDHLTREPQQFSCGCKRRPTDGKIKVYEDMSGWIMSEHGVPNSFIQVLHQDLPRISKNHKSARWRCKCLRCGKEFTTDQSAIRKGLTLSCGCLGKENRIKVNKAKHLITKEEYLKDLFATNINIELIGEYVDIRTATKHRCKICEYEWNVKPSNIVRDKHGCPRCAGVIKCTHEEFLDKIKGKDITVVGKYVNCKTPIRCICNQCGWEWFPQPSNLISGKGCPKCGGKLPIKQKEYEERLYALYPHIHLIGPYLGFKKETIFYCERCGGKFKSKPSIRVLEHDCPVCAHQVISDAPEYINSIWASPYKEYASKYMNEDDMKKYMPRCDKKLELICPDCGQHRKMALHHLFNDGFNCICNDNISFPNKFVYDILKQLKIKFQPEYNPKWIDNKRYDIYIKDYNLIIENHGMQHYSECTGLFSSKTLKEQEENDTYKYEMALKNGIKNYVILDCRYSNIEWIKKSVMNSDLPTILEFTENDIDWTKCLMATTTNIVKEAAKLWEEGMTCLQISKIYQLHSSTISKYLKNAAKIGWCSYTPQEAMKRKGIAMVGKINKNSVAVYCCDTNQVFLSYTHAKTICVGYKKPNISSACDGTYETIGGHHWKYLYDYTKRDGTIIPGAISLGLISEAEALAKLNTQQND